MSKIAIFGIGLTFNDYYEMLRKKHEVCCLVDNDSTKWGKEFRGHICQSPEVLKEIDVDKIIILTMWQKYIDEIKHQLNEYGLSEKTYLISELQEPYSRSNIKDSLYYTDDFDNKIIIGDGCSISELRVSFLGDNNEVRIDKNVRIVNTLYCVCRGSSCSFEVGKDTSMVGLNAYLAEGGKVSIGEDCMIASSVNVMQSACHPIYDINSGKRTNKKKDIFIGEHVWIGQNVGLMPGFSIGCGSVIGYGTVSSSKFGDNCIIAGNPAHIIREGITWKRDAIGYGDFDFM